MQLYKKNLIYLDILSGIDVNISQLEIYKESRHLSVEKRVGCFSNRLSGASVLVDHTSIPADQGPKALHRLNVTIYLSYPRLVTYT